jgi:hypothetical protein
MLLQRNSKMAAVWKRGVKEDGQVPTEKKFAAMESWESFQGQYK